MIEAGIRGRMERTVTEAMTAKAVGSGELEVLATPAAIALAEETAWRSLADRLEPGCGTVGTKIDFNHVSATPVGMKIRCEAEVTQVDGRKIVFRIELFDEAGKIGDGVHERFVVQNGKFLRRALEKGNPA